MPRRSRRRNHRRQRGGAAAALTAALVALGAAGITMTTGLANDLARSVESPPIPTSYAGSDAARKRADDVRAAAAYKRIVEQGRKWSDSAVGTPPSWEDPRGEGERVLHGPIPLSSEVWSGPPGAGQFPAAPAGISDLKTGNRSYNKGGRTKKRRKSRRTKKRRKSRRTRRK